MTRRSGAHVQIADSVGSRAVLVFITFYMQDVLSASSGGIAEHSVLISLRLSRAADPAACASLLLGRSTP